MDNTQVQNNQNECCYPQIGFAALGLLLFHVSCKLTDSCKLDRKSQHPPLVESNLIFFAEPLSSRGRFHPGYW